MYMRIQESTKNQAIAFIVAATGVYALVVMVLSIKNVYLASQSFFDGGSNLYPLAITIVTAISPLSFFVISLFVYKNIRSYFIIPFAIYGGLFVISYFVYSVFILLLFWWFQKNEVQPI